MYRILADVFTFENPVANVFCLFTRRLRVILGTLYVLDASKYPIVPSHSFDGSFHTCDAPFAMFCLSFIIPHLEKTTSHVSRHVQYVPIQYSFVVDDLGHNGPLTVHHAPYQLSLKSPLIHHLEKNLQKLIVFNLFWMVIGLLKHYS